MANSRVFFFPATPRHLGSLSTKTIHLVYQSVYISNLKNTSKSGTKTTFLLIHFCMDARLKGDANNYLNCYRPKNSASSDLESLASKVLRIELRNHLEYTHLKQFLTTTYELGTLLMYPRIFITHYHFYQIYIHTNIGLRVYTNKIKPPNWGVLGGYYPMNEFTINCSSLMTGLDPHWTERVRLRVVFSPDQENGRWSLGWTMAADYVWFVAATEHGRLRCSHGRSPPLGVRPYNMHLPLLVPDRLRRMVITDRKTTCLTGQESFFSFPMGITFFRLEKERKIVHYYHIIIFWPVSAIHYNLPPIVPTLLPTPHGSSLDLENPGNKKAAHIKPKSNGKRPRDR